MLTSMFSARAYQTYRSIQSRMRMTNKIGISVGLVVDNYNIVIPRQWIMVTHLFKSVFMTCYSSLG